MFGKHVGGRLIAYLDGRLCPAEAGRVADHLRRCEQCRRELEAVRFAARLAAALKPVETPSSLWNEIEVSLGESPAGQRRFRRRWIPAAAAASVLLAVAAYLSLRSRAGGWEVVRLAGAPAVGADRLGQAGRISVGEWLETDEHSRARIKVGAIGEVHVEPNTRIRLVAARLREHRLALAKGVMHAKIWAPPRLFFVETPAALAVDLGCIYTMRVDDQGFGLLRVISGWVLLEHGGRESMVPGGAMCRTRPGDGPGTPYFEDAPASLRDSLDRFDSGSGSPDLLPRILAEARPRDTLALWHLLSRIGRRDRSRVYDRMAALAPVPAGVPKEAVLRLDRAALERWRNELEWVW